MSQALREAVYREYMEFFERAEKNRRWSVFSDIAWEQLDPSRTHDVDAALCAETFVGVESYLPDYVSQGINLVRERFGQAWFTANWAYEESKHALSLREYLTRSGQRTSDQMFEFELAIQSKRWTAPFTTARQMTFYGAVQEQATLMMYKHQADVARKNDDKVLESIYRLIARDEAAHADFYRKVTKLEVQEDHAGAVKDMALVFKNFRMPGVGLVPDYDARAAVMRRTGGIDRGEFLKEVWFPTLKRLGIGRREITEASAQLRRAEEKDAA